MSEASDEHVPKSSHVDDDCLIEPPTRGRVSWRSQSAANGPQLPPANEGALPISGFSPRQTASGVLGAEIYVENGREHTLKSAIRSRDDSESTESVLDQSDTGATDRDDEEYLWDQFTSIPIDEEEQNSTEKCIQMATTSLKIFMYLMLFSVITLGLVIVKACILTLTSRLDFQSDGNQDVHSAWAYLVLIAVCAPYFFTFLQMGFKILFGQHAWPSIPVLIFGTAIEAAHSFGLSLMLFRVLPKLDAARGVMAMSAVAIAPSILNLMFGLKPRRNRCRKYAFLVMDCLAVLGQLSSIATFIFLPFTNSELCDLLDSVLDKYRPRVSATPPPSPTSRPRMIHGSPLQRDSLIGAMLQSPQTKPLQWVGEAMMPLSAESFSLCHQGLSCLSHLFSWIPLSDMITPSLLSTVFHFAAFGCDSAQAIALSGTSPSNAQQLGMLAMCCINELLAKNCVPADFEDYLLQMFQQTFYLLQKLTKDSPSPAAMSSTSGLDGLDVNFIEKFTEFLRLFVSNHLRRFEGNPNFPVLEFLSLLFKFTFQQTSLHCFYLCLDIWDIFLDYIVTKLGDRTMDNTSMLSKYSDGVMSVLSALLNKMHYQTNRLQLERLDDEEMNDDNETEWQHFLKQCNESIARIAELLPTQVLPVLFDKFEKMTNAYINLEQFIVVKSDNTSKWLGIEDASTLQQLHCVLRDLATMLQTLGRLVDNFISESFIPRLADGKCLINRFLQLATFNKRSQLYTVKTVPQAASVLKNDFIEIYSQTLATLKAFSCWIFSYYLEFGQDADGKAWCVTVVSSIADSLANLFTGPEHQQQVPKKIVQSAAHLLVSLVLTIRPPFLLELPSIAALYSDLGQGGLCSSLPKEVQLLLHRSLLSYLVIRWPGAVNGEQRWDTRAVAHAAFVQQVFASFLQLKGLLASLGSDAKLQEQVKPCIKMSLDILADFVDAISAETKKGKEICYASLQECIHLALALFPTFINHPDVLHDIMNFCYVLVQVLRVQMGAVFTGQMIESFISLLNRDRLAGIIAEEQAAGLSVIERLLQLLELIVQEPGYTFKPLLPKIVSVAIDHIYPLVAEIHVPDVKMPLFTLLSQLLDQNWSYFYKSVLATVSSQAARGLAGEDDGNDEVVERRGEFVNIMRAFFQSFLQPDVTIFRFNLEALEKLNARRKLYSKRIFREEILYQFISVLIQVLLVRSHDLLQEEIVVAIHNMAAVNFDVFFDKFLVQILDQIEYLSNEQKHTLMTAFAKEKDLPSFTANTQRFINDLRYYRLVNLSLPSGTVILAT